MEIVEYSSEYKEQVINLLKYLWTNRDYKQRKALFEWKYEYGSPIKNLMFIALINNHVVGLRGFTINPTRLMDRVFYIACLADAITDPNRRRLGIFNKLTLFSINSLEKKGVKIITSLSANKMSAQGNKKLGWIELFDKQVVFKIFPIGVLKNYRKNRNYELRSKRTKDNLVLQISDKLDFDVDSLANLALQNIQKDKITTIKNSIWYKWKLANPTKNYIYGTCWDNDQLVSFALLNRSKKYWTLVDYSFKDQSNLNKLLKFMFSELKPPIVITWQASLNTETKKILKKRGFYSYNLLLSLFNKKSEPVLIRPTCYPLNEHDWILDNYNLKDPNLWHVGIYDSDAT